MSAGSKIERASQSAHRAAGQMSLMLERKRLSRDVLMLCLRELEDAVSTIKAVLTPDDPADKVDVPHSKDQST